MENPKRYMKKGYYTHREPGVAISFTRYLVTEQDGHRYLLFQIENASELSFTAVSYSLTQLDADGTVLKHEHITADQLRLAPHGTYCLPQGLLLKPGCRDFRIQVLSAFSAPYRYTFHNGYTIAHYDLRDGGRRRASGHSSISVRRPFARSGRLHGMIAFLGLLSVLLLCILPAVLGWGRAHAATHIPRNDTTLAIQALEGRCEL